MHRALTLLALLATTATVPLAAQAPSAAVAPGARVRVVSPNASGVFTVVRVTADSLTIARDAAAPIQVLRLDVQRLDVSLGPRSTGAGIGRGMLIGGAVGGAAGIGVGLADGGDWLFSRRDVATIFGVLGTAAGALVGGIVGATKTSERWERVFVRPSVGVVPGPNPRALVRLTRTF